MIHFILLIVVLVYHLLLAGVLLAARRRGPGTGFAGTALAIVALIAGQLLTFPFDWHTDINRALPPDAGWFSLLQWAVLVALLLFLCLVPSRDRRILPAIIALILLGLAGVAFAALAPAQRGIPFPGTTSEYSYRYHPFFFGWLLTAWAVALARAGILWARARGTGRARQAFLFLFTVQLILPLLIAPLHRETGTPYQVMRWTTLLVLVLTSTFAACAFMADAAPTPRRRLFHTALPATAAITILGIFFYTVTSMLVTPLIYLWHLDPRLAYFLTAIVTAAAFQPLRQLVRGTIDRMFLRADFAPAVALRTLGERLLAARGRDARAAALVNTLREALPTRATALYLADGQAQRLVAGDADALPMLEGNDALVAYARGHRRPFTAEDFSERDFLWPVAIRLGALGGVVALPLPASDGLCGLLLLGEQLSGDPYTAREMEFLATAAVMAGLALREDAACPLPV